VHEKRHEILGWLCATTTAWLHVLWEEMGKGLGVWLLLNMRLLPHRRVGNVHG